MKIADRVASLKSSPTLALNARVQQLTDVINFTVGEPDYPTPQITVETAISALKNQRTKYGPAGGGLPLRRAISEKLKRENKLTYSPDEIVVGCGAKEILCHLFLSLVNSGDEVLLPSPYWVSYEDQIKLAQGVPTIIPPAFDRMNNLLLAPEMLEAYATKKTVGLVLCSPSNPTGSVLSREALTRLATYLKDKNWWIISDEIYEYFSYDSPHSSLVSLCPELRERFILVNGLSKSFAMTGWRVGYAAGPESLIKVVKTLQSHTSTCVPPFIEDAAEWTVAQGASLMRDEIASMKRRRDLALELVAILPNISWIPPQGAFYLWLDLRPLLAKSSQYGTLSSLAFCEGLLEQQKVAAVPGEAFGCPGYLRISYACDEEKLREGFRRLSLYLQHLRARGGV
jgi:aspartate aminotransferase